MSEYQLAQLNVARLKFPFDSPEMAEFVAALEPINALADGAPGFVWRLVSEGGDATSLRPLGDETLVNMSVWTSLEALGDFTYRSVHVDVLRRRREWFERMAEIAVVLWWIPRDTVPGIDEAIARLDHLRQHGPSPTAFSFRRPFAPPDAPSTEARARPADACPAA